MRKTTETEYKIPATRAFLLIPHETPIQLKITPIIVNMTCGAVIIVPKICPNPYKLFSAVVRLFIKSQSKIPA